MLDLLVDLVAQVIFGGTKAAIKAAQRSSRVEQREAKKPSESSVRRIEAAYRAWAESHGWSWDDERRAWCGSRLGAAVRVKPGLTGSSPDPVFAEIEIAHDHERPLLLTRSSPREDPTTRAIAELFDDVDLEVLRAIALVPHGVTLRFVALAPPDIIEHAVEAVTRKLRRDGDRPYR